MSKHITTFVFFAAWGTRDQRSNGTAASRPLASARYRFQARVRAPVASEDGVVRLEDWLLCSGDMSCVSAPGL